MCMTSIPLATKYILPLSFCLILGYISPILFYCNKSSYVLFLLQKCLLMDHILLPDDTLFSRWQYLLKFILLIQYAG